MKAISDWHEDATGQRIAPQAWKEWFKQTFLGQATHAMPNGDIVTTTARTSALGVSAMGEFLTRIEAWAAEQDGLELPRGEDYQGAMEATW